MALKNLIKCLSLASIFLFVSFVSAEDDEEVLEFPPGFIMGAASSAYQVEGGWNADDKGESMWDYYMHNTPNHTKDGNNGDIASDSYHNYAEDAKILKDLGMDFYRFSLSWPRILPTGYPNVISEEGVAYYNKVLDELEARNITPLVTIYHWDHPQLFQFMGGWTNDVIVDAYADYARVVFKTFGHRIKNWITINEPNAICRYAYLYGIFAPAVHLGPHGEYLCNANILKAHARAYRMYEKEFKEKQGGRVGITLEMRTYFAKNKDDTESPDTGFQFQFGVYAHPIFSKKGDWPDKVKEMVQKNCDKEGLPRSRLPVLSEELINDLKGSADFLGVNYYTSMMVEPLKENEIVGDDSLMSAPTKYNYTLIRDHGLKGSYNPDWPPTTFAYLKMVPEGLLEAFKNIKREYDNPLVYVTENGIADMGTLADNERLDYVHGHMKNMLIAIHKHGCNIKGYTYWSLLDSFEWVDGFGMKFGLVQVDFNSPNRTRTLKNSSNWIKEVTKTRKLVPVKDYKVANAPVPPVCDGTPEHCGIGSIHNSPEFVDIYYHSST